MRSARKRKGKDTRRVRKRRNVRGKIRNRMNAYREKDAWEVCRKRKGENGCKKEENEQKGYY